jgi:NADH dehydrogenase [ubiquinone] 1 alpha subcomplex assembly factor 7
MNLDLENYIKNKIIRYGPITIAEYMSIISYKENHGYYESHNIGQDFITSPQISKSFGGLIAIWFYQLWKKYFYQQSITLIELGPGNGELISSMVKVFLQIPEFFNKISMILIENSKYLKKIQEEKLNFLLYTQREKVNWFTNLGECNIDSPIFLIANEFFDCLPINQFVYKNNSLYEILIDFNEKNNKFYRCLSKNLSNSHYLINKNYFINDKIIEISTSTMSICKYINNILKNFLGISLIIDYGYLQFPGKSSLQGIYKHEISNIFENIGKTDISAHVNFLDLINEFKNCENMIYTQEDFLRNLKLNRIIHNNYLYKNDTRESMGSLFKVLYSKNVNL